MNAAGHAFLSYVHEDAARVDAIEERFRHVGMDVWRDKQDLWPGVDWKSEIRKAIADNALALVACFSQAAAAKSKSYQNEELVLAAEQERLRRPGVPWIIPVRFDDCEVPAYDLGAGRTLDSIQRIDLFGDDYEKNLTRLTATVSRILGTSGPGEGAAPARTDAGRVRDLLGSDEQVLALDGVVLGLARACAQELADPQRFPVDQLPQETYVRTAVDRIKEYDDLVQPLSEALVIGCGYGRAAHHRTWTRAVETVAPACMAFGSGEMLLVQARTYPLRPLIFAAAMGALHRENYGSLMAVTQKPQMWDQQGNRVPVIGDLHVWLPFQQPGDIPNVLAVETTKGRPLEKGELATLSKRHTPVSDHLHDRLRPLLAGFVFTDDDYDDLFDETEVVLALLAEGAAAQTKAAGDWQNGMWLGAFWWRRQRKAGFVSTVWERHKEGLLAAGAFGGDAEVGDATEQALSQQTKAQRPF